MTDPNRKPTSYTAGFFMLIAFGVAGFILASMLGMGLIMAKTGQMSLDAKQLMSNPAYFRDLQIMQTLSAIFGFFIPTVITASYLNRKPLGLIGFQKKTSSTQVMLTLLIILCGLGISSGLGYLSYQLPLPAHLKANFDQLEANYVAQAASLVRLNSIPELLLSIIVLALVPAVCEEVFFRGGLQNFMYRSNHKMWFTLIVVSLIFSAVHFSGYGFLSRVALGLILGLLYHFTQNIWLNILAHFVNNALAVILMYSQVQSGKPLADAMNDKSGTYLGLLALPLLVVLLKRLKPSSPQNQSAHGI